MERINWNKIIDGITVFMLGIVLLILVVCTVVLLAFDSLVGAGSMMVFTNQHVGFSTLISLATTGMTIALAFMAYLAGAHGYQKAGALFGVAAAFVAIVDVYFDSLTADWLRYGAFMAIRNLPVADQNNHILFRILIGGLSLIGEPLAVAIIVGMPDLKRFIRSVLPKTQQPPQPTAPRQYPTSLPRANQTPPPAPRPAPRPIPAQPLIPNEPTFHPVSFPKDLEEFLNKES